MARTKKTPKATETKQATYAQTSPAIYARVAQANEPMAVTAADDHPANVEQATVRHTFRLTAGPEEMGEVGAIQVVVAILVKLKEDERRRVMRYLADRFYFQGNIPRDAAQKDTQLAARLGEFNR